VPGFVLFKLSYLYQAYKNLYPQKRWETLEKLEMFLKKKILVLEKNISAPISKLDLVFGSQYRNLYTTSLEGHKYKKWAEQKSMPFL
jgi:hypothetical protein